MNGGRGVFVQVLGGVHATRDGRDVPLGGAKQRAVLAQLVLARGRAVPAGRLLLTLWPDAGNGGGTAMLHTYVSRLRRALGSEVIGTNAAGYRLTVDEDAVDAWCFEAGVTRAGAAQARGDAAARLRELEGALALWRGAAYADYRDADWAQAEIARLDELHEVAREGVLAARLDTGHPAGDLVPALEALVAEAPLREERWRLLALALYRSNRQADALGALRRARDVLADELGIDPGPALRGLEEQVLRQAPELGVPEPAAPPPSAGPPPPTSQPQSGPSHPTTPAVARTDVLLERDGDVRRLEHALEDAVAGRGSVVAVVGSAGIGKSRLMAEVRSLAALRGVPVHAARGSVLEQQFGFGVVRQLFEAAVYAHPDDALLDGPAAGARAVFAPPSTAEGASPSEDVAFAVLNALHWLTVRLAGDGPIVLLVDDIQWSDLESTRFLAYLSRRVEQLPILLVYAERSGERYPAAELVHELEADPRTTVIRPRPLTSSGASALIRARFGSEVDADFAAACHEVSGGNPLVLRQLVQSLEHDGVPADADHAATVRARGSRAVAAMVLPRLRGLPGAAAGVARAIAVLGDGAQLPLIAAHAGLDEQDVAAGTSGLVAAEILAPTAPLGFVHPLIGEAVYSDIAVGERPLLHERAARLLDETGADPESVAAQLLHAPHRGDPWTVAALRRAAQAAAARGGSEAVVAYLRRALSEPCAPEVRATVLFDLGRAESARHGPAALLHLEEAYEQLEDPDRRASAAVQLARTMIFVAPPGTATQFAHQVADDLPPGADERQALYALARIGGHMGGVPGDQWHFGVPPDIQGQGTGAHMLRSALAWEYVCQGEPRERVVELCRAALADQTLYRADNGLLWVVATVALDLADVDVMPLWETALSIANQEGSLFAALSVHLWRAFSLLRHGRLHEAVQSVQLSVHEMRMWDNTLGVAYGSATMARAYRELGNLDAAQAVLDDDIDVFPGTDGERLVIEARAELLLALGRPAEALEVVERARGLVTHAVNPAWRADPLIRARALDALGERAAADDLLEGALGRARRWGAPSTLTPLLRARAGVRPADARPLLAEAVELSAASPARLERAKCLRALGRHLRDDEPARAAALLADAAALFAACGVRATDRAGDRAPVA